MSLLNKNILFWKDPEIKKIIENQQGKKAADVAMSLSKLPVEKRTFIVNQIGGRLKAKDKFPFLLESREIIYPLRKSLEQSSSESTAKFKASMFSGNKFIDLTCGFGIDSFFIAQNFKKSSLVDNNSTLLTVVKHNFEHLQQSDIEFFHEEALNHLNSLTTKADLIYLDPSRRVENKKVFLISDCQPNLLEILPKLVEMSEVALIKLSPMIDITDVTKKINSIKHIQVVSLNGECKEVLIQVSDSSSFHGEIECVELGKSSFRYSFSLEKEQLIDIQPTDIRKYLYQPNTAITKAGAFKSLCQDFQVKKISANTHIYTNEKLSENFPGKKYEVLKSFGYSKAKLQSSFPNEKGFNIVKRNFPDDVNQIVKKLNIGLSGSLYLFAYRNYQNKNEVAICRLIDA